MDGLFFCAVRFCARRLVPSEVGRRGPRAGVRSMIAVVQRVARASVVVDEPAYAATIERGLLVLLGVEQADDPALPREMARKLALLRIFPDDEGRMNRSVRDVGGAILVISQFTLAGDCRRGNRPSFVAAAPPEQARPMYEEVADHLVRDHGLTVRLGVFGAHMHVTLCNDGPVTIILRLPAPP